MAAIFSLAETVKRAVATERENLEDLIAEAKAEARLSRVYATGQAARDAARATAPVPSAPESSTRERDVERERERERAA